VVKFFFYFNMVDETNCFGEMDLLEGDAFNFLNFRGF